MGAGVRGWGGREITRVGVAACPRIWSQGWRRLSPVAAASKISAEEISFAISKCLHPLNGCKQLFLTRDLITQALAESPPEHLSRYPSVHTLLHPLPDSTHTSSIYPSAHSPIHPPIHLPTGPVTLPHAHPPRLLTPCTHLILTKPSALIRTHPPALLHTRIHPPRPHPSTELLINSPILASVSKEQILDTVCQVQFPTSLCASGLVCKIGIKIGSTGLGNLGGKGWSPHGMHRVREA